MAPIYIAQPAKSNSAPTPLFKLKGLDNLHPTQPSQTNIYGLPLEKQIAYDAYICNIGPFIAASAQNRRIRIDGRAIGPIDFAHHLPLAQPLIKFTLAKESSNDFQDELILKLGPGASKEKSGNVTIFSAPALPTGSIPVILKMASTTFNTGKEAINPAGVEAFRFLTGAMGEILRVHSYAAFTNESEESLVEIKQLLEAGGEYHKLGNAELKTVDRTEVSKTLYDVKLQEEAEGVSLDVSEGRTNWIDKLNASKSILMINGKDSVTTANPPKAPVINVGSIASCPRSQGIVFPYFEGLVQPDAQTLLSFAFKHLNLLLAKTPQECMDKFKDLRRGINSLSTHVAGMVLAHIAKGIELSFETQSRCYVIIDSSTYKGFVLLGARYAIFANTRWYAALSENDLRTDLERIDPHSNAVARLVEMFGEMEESESYTGETVTAATFENPANLIAVFKKINLTMVAEIEAELNHNFRSLNYIGGGYFARNPQNVIEVVTTILSDTTLALETPTYIPDIRTNLESRSFICLSKFGPESISLWNERGKEYKCVAEDAPTTTQGKRKIGTKDDFANLPEAILVTPKPLASAVKDMEKVIDKGMIKMNMGERSGKNRNMVIQAEGVRKSLWKVLVNGVKDPNAKKIRREEREDAGSKEDVDLDALLKML